MKTPEQSNRFDFSQMYFYGIDLIKKSPAMLSVIAMIIAVLLGCASRRSDGKKLPQLNLINDIVISEDSDSLLITIKGNHMLKNEAIKRSDPLGVEFNFPNTTLEISEGFYNPPKNDIVRFIKADEVAEGNRSTSRILIALKEDRPYRLIEDALGLQVAFAKDHTSPEPIESQKESAMKTPAATPTEPQADFTESTLVDKTVEPQQERAKDTFQAEKSLKSAPAASQLESVTVTPLKNYMVVHVKADGTIYDYTSFSMDNPARIVFDMPGINSRKKAEQRIAIGSKWVNQIRYFGHPNKVRLVIETDTFYLSKYSAVPTDTGLLIHVGQVPALSIQSSPKGEAESQGTEQVTLAWDGVSNATLYNIYWSSSPGVTRYNSNKIANAKSPQTVKGLRRGQTYYFVVTAVSESGESEVSEEIAYTVGQ